MRRFPRLLARPTEHGEVERGLASLSFLLDETAAHYVARLQREIRQLTLAVRALERSEGQEGKKSRKLLAKAAAKLQSLPIAPEKGRRKDLRKIDRLIGELEGLLEETSRENGDSSS
ncbi:hypothetical protein MAMC_01958 [Methylacidimicrobium cyclopophantes]|uniref:Uncharacterized protein n=1 Tax=Methylacidimicrobium cyclopophantes TaxID=1041766 RepID=A0A5E6MQS1_9BACT|nr:hypothetical protein [Methylacidimicrobium cyclopophantes]VVM08066.1 hypothetical protein MAMC_01958 [Methylacidimicrobium cyclopophantes]